LLQVLEAIRQRAARTPDKPILRFNGQTTTHGQLLERAARVANAQRVLGLEPGDRVAYLGKNTEAWYELLLGGTMTGAIQVSVNWRFATPEVESILDDSGARLLVIEPEFAMRHGDLRARLSGLDYVVVLGRPGFDAEAYSAIGYDEWTESASAADIGPDNRITSDSTALLLYTSGTTGQPKGAAFSFRRLDAGPDVLVGPLEMTEDSTSLVFVPLFHTGGLGISLLGLREGALNIVLPEVDPAAVLRTIEKDRVTHILAVPTILQMLIDAAADTLTDFSSLRMVAYGASAIAETTLRQAIDLMGAKFAQVYGSTETCMPVTILLPEDHQADPRFPDRLRSAGSLAGDAEVRIVDPHSRDDAAVGSVGEIWARCSTLMTGYWRRPRDTAEALTPDGWFRTGDAGHLDENGYLFIDDRVKDMIISGGENIYPAEVENAVAAHPGVWEVTVIGLPDERWGEAVTAMVVPRPGHQLTEAEIITFARARLANYKCPKRVCFLSGLPHNATGKVIRRELREQHAADRKTGASHGQA